MGTVAIRLIVPFILSFLGGSGGSALARCLLRNKPAGGPLPARPNNVLIFRHLSLITAVSNALNLESCRISYSYSAICGTRTRSICAFEYEYHFIEYEYDGSSGFGGVRRVVPPLTLIVILTLFTISIGCSQSSPPSSQSPSGLSDENTKNQTVVVDRLNRTIRFTKAPRRIVSLLPSTTELMFAIGAGHQMVGSTDHCNYPVAAMTLTRIGGGMLHDISRETILSLNPDLILCKWDSQQPLIEPFDRLNIPVVAVGSDSLAELIGEATLLGRVTGHEAEASSLIENMKRRLVALTSLVDSIPMERRRRTFYEVWDEPLMTAGPKSFIGELMEMGGMKNIFSDTLVGYPKISEEVVLDRDPEVILAPSTHRSKVSLEILAKRQGWDRITAVRDRQVFLIDGDQVSRCGPRMLDALEEMIRAVYPDQLPKVGAREQPGEGADR